jgi:hypothetical protein
VLASPNAAAEAPWWRSPPSAVFASGTWRESGTRHPTPIEALAPRGGVRTRGRRRLETQSCPHTGLVMTGDVAERLRCRQARGRGASRGNARSRGEARVDVPSSARAARPVVPDRAWRSVRTVRRNRGGTRSRRLDLDVWLIHPPLATPRGTSPWRRPYRARACSTRRARSCARGSRALSLCRVSFRAAPGSACRHAYAAGRARPPRKTPT